MSPREPDAVNTAINAKRLAAFAVNGGVTVEYVADNAALSEKLKKQYGDPVALISGDYESKNGDGIHLYRRRGDAIALRYGDME